MFKADKILAILFVLALGASGFWFADYQGWMDTKAEGEAVVSAVTQELQKYKTYDALRKEQGLPEIDYTDIHISKPIKVYNITGFDFLHEEDKKEYYLVYSGDTYIFSVIKNRNRVKVENFSNELFNTFIKDNGNLAIAYGDIGTFLVSDTDIIYAGGDVYSGNTEEEILQEIEENIQYLENERTKIVEVAIDKNEHIKYDITQ